MVRALRFCVQPGYSHAFVTAVTRLRRSAGSAAPSSGVLVDHALGSRLVMVLGGLGVHPADRLSGAGRRVLAYSAVKGPRVNRILMSMRLWPNLDEGHARANLRRALWQIPPGWVTAQDADVVLEAEVDLREAYHVASRALSGEPLDADQVELLNRDLLPGWYDDWVVSEQDQYHLRRIQALEEACRTAARSHHFSLATTAGLAAVCAEPLRESAVTVLVEAHVLEGNRVEAARRYQAYRDRLQREIGVEPGRALYDLVTNGVAHGPRGTADRR